MNSLRAFSQTRASGKSVLAGLLVLLVFLSALAAGNPVLHHWLHKDHQSPTHYCLVSMLGHGHGHSADDNVIVADLPALCVPLTVFVETFVSSHDFFLLPVRGPPVLS